MVDPIETSEGQVNPLSDNNSLLQATIFNNDKESRKSGFSNAWQARWNAGSRRGYFQTEEVESPFSRYSSRGWKIHIAYEKGKERDVAELMYVNGLHFKIESEIGTYFNGNKESGATVYVGSYSNTLTIAGVIAEGIGQYLTDGAVAHFSNRTIRIGSGADIEIRPRITARFDVAKTPFGWLEGNGKYSEHGIPTWMGLGGITLLKKFESEVARIERNWGKMLPSQRKIYLERVLKPAYEESRAELVKDFGQEFVFG